MSEFKSQESILLEAVGTLNQKNLIGKLTVVSHAINDTARPGDRKATLMAVEGAATGSVDVFFDRLDIAEVLAVRNAPAIVLRGNNIPVAEIARILREEMRININVVDVTTGNEEVITAQEGTQSIAVPISNESLLFEGEIQLVILPQLEDQDGFTLVNTPGVPLFETDHLETMPLQPVGEPLGAIELKAPGEILVGTGIPDTHMHRVSNGELSLAFAVRPHQQAGTEDPIEGIFELALPSDGDWGFLWSIGLYGPLADRDLLDVYDISMTWTKLDTNEQLKLFAVRGDNKINWQPAGGEFAIIDGPVSTKVTQNSQRIRFYANHVFTPTSVLSDKDTMIGEFTFQIDAVRKNSAEDVRLSLYAVAQISEVVPPIPEEEAPQ